jgi:hypothetical protein
VQHFCQFRPLGLERLRIARAQELPEALIVIEIVGAPSPEVIRLHPGIDFGCQLHQKERIFTALPHHSQKHFRVLQAQIDLLTAYLCNLVLRGILLCSVPLVSNLVSLHHLHRSLKSAF